MRVLLDTCVLYPSILRSILLGAAQKGLFEPIWSEKIIEEWRHAAQRNHDEAEATIVIALLRVNWPKSRVEIGPENKNLFLPDENDIHVLQAAIEGNADGKLTLKEWAIENIRVLAKVFRIKKWQDHHLWQVS